MKNLVWKVLERKIEKKEKEWLLKVLAKNRNIDSPEKLKEFLNPTFTQITNQKLSQLQEGIKRVEEALLKKEKIIVYSDYDADGICASAIMWETLNDLGASVLPYVPHRIKEGYGLSKSAIEKLKKDGTKLIITVDHGVTAKEQVEFAKNIGIDIVITDHHVLPKELPKPIALVHTTDLCGAGVSWRFCWELISKIAPDYKEKLKEKLELAAIATVADLVPLVGANRAIVKLGLEYLNKTKRPGILSLVKNSGITKPVKTFEIGHVLAPRINAMGRIEHGLDSLRLICSRNKFQAEKLANLLTKTNTKRQDLTSGAVEAALSMVDGEQLVGVLAHGKWHEGVIGLVASRLVEAHHKPMIVISKGEVFSKGSARSIPGFNIVEAIRSTSELLVDAGGHPMAAGFTIETQHIEAFSKKINVFAQTSLTEELLTPVVQIECELSVEDINFNNLEVIEKLEPFGQGNNLPFFLIKNLEALDTRRVGGTGQHIKIQFENFSAIGFNKSDITHALRPGHFVDLVFTIARDDYNGKNGIQLKIKDLKIKGS